MVKWYHRALIRLYLEFDSRFSYKNTEGTTAACHSALKADMHEQSWGIDTSIFRLIYSFSLIGRTIDFGSKDGRFESSLEYCVYSLTVEHYLVAVGGVSSNLIIHPTSNVFIELGRLKWRVKQSGYCHRLLSEWYFLV